jgi:uncharacterized protein (DUF362 family)
MESELQRSTIRTRFPPTVAVVREDHDDLPGALRSVWQRSPCLLPASLPRQVVIKPNLCDIAAWETGVTTDPRWLGALSQELRSIRPDVLIRVVESDAISAYKTHRSCDETFERLGFVSAAQDAGVELLNLSRCDTIEIRVQGIPYPVRIPDLFLEEMYFISIANLKVHGYTRMTGVLKNSIGLLTDSDISSFHPYLSTLVSHLHLLCPPDLAIIDGRIGLEGHGPIMGDPVHMNSIIAGNDALAVDETACHLMGIAPEDVPYLRHTTRALGRKFGDFEISGDVQARKFAFQSPETHRTILVKFGNRRLHQRSEAFINRWIDRSLRLRQDPVAFTKSAFSYLARSKRAR